MQVSQTGNGEGSMLPAIAADMSRHIRVPNCNNSVNFAHLFPVVCEIVVLKICSHMNFPFYRFAKLRSRSVLLALLLCTGCYIDQPGLPIQPATITSLGFDAYQITVDARAPW